MQYTFFRKMRNFIETEEIRRKKWVIVMKSIGNQAFMCKLAETIKN